MYAVDSFGDAERDAYENGCPGVVDVRARKARAGDTELADAVRRVTVGCRIMIEYDHLGGDQRHRGERRDQCSGGDSFFGNFHGQAGKIYPTAAGASMSRAGTRIAGVRNA